MPRALTLAAILGALCAGAAALGADEPRPGPFIFVHGLQQPGSAATARAMGCTALYLDLSADAPRELEEARAILAEASDEGLQVIVGLPTKLGGAYRISPREAGYVAAVREFVREVVGALKGTPGIAAWATDHYLERDISYTDADFRAWLLDRYGSLLDLNASWGAHYRALEEVTREGVKQLDFDQAYGVGRASVDLAEYERGTFHDVTALWADAVRAADPDTALMTGRISLYRSLTAIPDRYAIVQVHMPPDVLEPDVLTHNVHAVQMARRGGRFEVIPWLRVPLPPSEAYSRASLSRWVMEAGLRGAVGVCLEDWERISAQQWVLNNIVDQLRGALSQAPFTPDAPRPCAAVIHAPYAGGHLFQGTPAYGYITDYPEGDLAELAVGYRLGTAFGGLDYLCAQDLPVADLSGYSMVLAPACLSLPPEVVASLQAYVEGGGALFADLGAGMYQMRSWDPAASPLAALAGISAAIEPADRFGTFRVGQAHPALPSARVGLEAEGTFVPGQPQNVSLGDATRRSYEGPATLIQGYAFRGLSWFVGLRTGAIPVATQSVRFDGQQRPHFLGITAADVGLGLTLFAPFPAWSHWPPQDALHAAIHGDLMARRARYRVVGAGFADPGIGLAGSDRAVHLLSRSGATSAQVLAAAADHRVYLGAACTFSAAARTAEGRRTGTALLTVEITPGGMAHCEAIPVRVRPEAGEAHARVVVYAPGMIALDVGGQGAAWGRAPRDGPIGYHGAEPVRVRFTINDGTYPVEPGSSHEVRLEQGRDQPQTATITADHRGRLDFWLTVTGGRMTVTPAAG
ncbi:MAG: beta-galactosidase [Armatimonadota bacterium]